MVANDEQRYLLGPQGPAIATNPKHLGPLEISASNRKAILIGIWFGMFLSVRNKYGNMLPTNSTAFRADFEQYVLYISKLYSLT